MSNGGAQSASGIATYRTARELGSRSPRSYAAVREPNELVVIHRFSRSADPRAKSTASFVAADGAISLGSEAMANLVRDAQCLAKNWHPNIARVRHVELAGDELTVATELVDGTTLGDLLQAAAAERARGATGTGEPLLPLPVLVRILVDVVTGLSGLHGLRDEKGAQLGTIHGALSPANIVVGKDGVARLLNALRPRPLRMAAGTEAVGYAAPEALDLGATQDVRADLHSVGVIMWEALNGRRLYDETDPARVLARQREEDVPPPAFPAGSPFARLADVTMQAMAFEASLRFKTAAELGAALRNIAATRIATGSVVASRVAELAGDRIRGRRVELDPGATGKRRLGTDSDRALRTAKPATATASATAAASSPATPPAPSAERDTLPPGSMDGSELGPASGRPLDLSVRDFLAAGETPSAPALAAATPAAPAAAAPAPPPPKTVAKPAPPLLRKTAPAAPPAAMKAPSVAMKAPPAAQSTLKGTAPPAAQSTLRGMASPPQPAPVAPEQAPIQVATVVVEETPARAAPVVVEETPAPPATVIVEQAPAPPATVIVEQAPAPPATVIVEQAPIQPAAVTVVGQPPVHAAPRAVFDSSPMPVAAAPSPAPWPDSSPAMLAAPAPPSAPEPPQRAAYVPVTHSTPDAFTPSDAAPPRDRRSLAGIFLGCALALVLLVGFFAVRAMVTSSGTKTSATPVAPSSEATGTAKLAPSAEPTGDKPTEPKTEISPAASGTASAAAPESTTTPVADAPPTPATAAAPGDGPAPPAPAGVVRAPAEGAGAPGGAAPAVKPPSGAPPKPKRSTYEPLGI